MRGLVALVALLVALLPPGARAGLCTGPLCGSFLNAVASGTGGTSAHIDGSTST